MIFSSGASVATVASMRTWALPCPGRRGGGRRLGGHLVVALPGAAVGDRVAAGRPGDVDGELGDQRSAERGEQRIAQPVDRVGLDRRDDVVEGGLLARVDEARVDRAELARLALDDRVVLAR